jgi:hypothetical protein
LLAEYDISFGFLRSAQAAELQHSQLDFKTVR